MDRIASISAFVHVVELGSFAATARRLKMAPAMVTNHVQALEEQLGIRLLNRTTRKVAPTEDGAGYYRHCLQILSDFAEAESFARARQSTPSGIFRLNTDVALARILSPLVAEYVAVYPEVSFELIMTDQMADMIDERFDLAVRAGELPDSASLIRRTLGIGRFVLCAAPDYVARRGAPDQPKDLADHNCLKLAQARADERWRFAGAGGEHAVVVDGSLRSNSIEAIRAATAAGQGLCLLPMLIVADDLMSGRLVRLLPEYTTPDALIHAVYPAGGHVPSKVRTFLDFIVRRLRESGTSLRGERKPGTEVEIMPPARPHSRAGEDRRRSRHHRRPAIN